MDKSHLHELKTMKDPPELVKKALEAVECMITGKLSAGEWK